MAYTWDLSENIVPNKKIEQLRNQYSIGLFRIHHPPPKQRKQTSQKAQPWTFYYSKVARWYPSGILTKQTSSQEKEATATTRKHHTNSRYITARTPQLEPMNAHTKQLKEINKIRVYENNSRVSQHLTFLINVQTTSTNNIFRTCHCFINVQSSERRHLLLIVKIRASLTRNFIHQIRNSIYRLKQLCPP